MAYTNNIESFDVVSDDSDHYFLLPGPNPNYFMNANRNVHKRIMKEWKMLAHNLPESIYVRVYEKLIDLLRAVIIGATGTPYHDGLFFFHIAFPVDSQPAHHRLTTRLCLLLIVKPCYACFDARRETSKTSSLSIFTTKDVRLREWAFESWTIQ
ncbi:hypothetical protein VNO78_22809 [Psophocarpus tetragonolobus]|uniref:UBC core domain-containing protein n=1 Tax=Psophocarpus tetragonolobus TaxID=3891 RepID=A0AAN9S284_PSOTE